MRLVFSSDGLRLIRLITLALWPQSSGFGWEVLTGIPGPPIFGMGRGKAGLARGLSLCEPPTSTARGWRRRGSCLALLQRIGCFKLTAEIIEKTASILAGDCLCRSRLLGILSSAYRESQLVNQA